MLSVRQNLVFHRDGIGIVCKELESVMNVLFCATLWKLAEALHSVTLERPGASDVCFRGNSGGKDGRCGLFSPRNCTRV